MKLSQKLCAAAMVATFGAAILAPTALAATSVTGEGKIVFTEDTTLPPVTPPGTTEPVITEPEVNTDPAALKIVSVTNLDFDTNAIESSNANKVYPANAFTAPVADANGDPTATTLDMAHFVRFQDKRADGLENTYKIGAKLTKQFTHTTNTTKTLAGATIDYKNAKLVTGSNAATKPSDSILTTSFEVNATDTVDVLDQDEVGKGFGVFEIMFGDLTDYSTDATTPVNLKVPGTNVVQVGTYTGEVTWYMTDAR